MDYSRKLWALGQFMLHWVITTATNSMPLSLNITRQLLTHFRAQDAPHALGGALGDQFSWSASHVRLCWRALKIFSLGTTTTSPAYGTWNSGYRKPRLTRRARTMVRIAFSVPMGCELYPSTPICVSVTAFLGRNELTRGHDPGYRYGRLRSRFL